MSTTMKPARRQTADPADPAEAAAEVSARYTTEGELRWTCPACLQEHPESRMICSCEAVRPALRKLREAARLSAPNPVGETRRRPRKNLDRSTTAAEVRVSAPQSDAADEEGPRVSGVPPRGHFEPRLVPLSLIRWRDDNPRGPATAEEVARKAATLEREGQLAPIGVRALPDGTLEGWWGERRCRAAEMLKWESIQAVVFPPETPDLVLRGLRAAENLDQEDLDPIARARHLAERLTALGWNPDSQGGKSLRSLASELGMSQGDLSHHLGLLKLPEEWQRRLIAREITPTQARSLLPWIDRPTVLQEVRRRLQQRNLDSLTTSDFSMLVSAAVRHVAIPCDPGKWIGLHPQAGKQRTVCLTAQEIAEHAQELDIVEIESLSGSGRERVAFNVSLFKRLNASAAQRKQDREERRAARVAARTTPPPPQKSPQKSPQTSPQPSPAETQRPEDRQASRLALRVARYKRRWLQQWVAARIANQQGTCICSLGTLLRLLLYFTTTSRGSRNVEIAEAVTEAGGRRRTGPTGIDVWSTLASLAGRPDATLQDLAAQLVARWVSADCESAHSGLHCQDVTAIAADLGVDLKQEWRIDEEFLRLFPREQLEELAHEWRLTLEGQTLLTRDDVIAAILAADQRRRLPPPKILKQTPC